jgi:chromosome segregation protein
VKGHEEGVEAIEYLKRESTGRGSFIPRELYRREQQPISLMSGDPGIVGPLLKLVSVKEGFGEIAEYLLNDVVVVRDLTSGLRLWSRNGFVNTLVTLDGEVVDPMGVVTGGSGQYLEGNLLSQKRRIKELEARLIELQARLGDEESELEILTESVDQIETTKSALVEEAHRLQVERIQLEHGLLQVDQEVTRLEEYLGICSQEQENLSAALFSQEKAIQEGQTSIDEGHREKAEREQVLTGLQETQDQLHEDLRHVESQVTESRVRAAAVKERKESARLNLQNRTNLRGDLTAQIRSRESLIDEMNQRRIQLEEAVEVAEISLEEGKKTLQQLEDRLEKERQEYRDISSRVTGVDEAIKELRPMLETSQDEKNHFQILLSEKRLGFQHLLDDLREKYSLDLRDVAIERSGEETAAENLPEEIEEIRTRLERMGGVDLTSIGELEELGARYEYLNQQKTDLEKSMTDLQRTIAKLNRLCRVRFKESFEQINQRFQEMFIQLFGGGRARLILTDENDYLETGVDIVAQPPGKKLQAITLLSGGEKALTAISLLFAIFLTKPSPFCLLDEVDAPLDDSNVERFIEIIKRMSSTSQFVLITHNKRTMQAAEILYGITMADPGISKVVTVKMS